MTAHEGAGTVADADPIRMQTGENGMEILIGVFLHHGDTVKAQTLHTYVIARKATESVS